jgi:hypothetical protein
VGEDGFGEDSSLLVWPERQSLLSSYILPWLLSKDLKLLCIIINENDGVLVLPDEEQLWLDFDFSNGTFLRVVMIVIYSFFPCRWSIVKLYDFSTRLKRKIWFMLF